MASYADWNHALVSFFVSGVPRGAPVFLSVDDDVLRRVGGSVHVAFDDGFPAAADMVDDFQRAVRARVLGSGGVVNLGDIRGRDANGEPRGVAFLCACVLAATQMADEEAFSEINYFGRLRDALGVSREKGRPDGMPPGDEEPSWREWNQWLQERGFLPSARRGDSLPTRFINYPISQALLRRADRDRLRRLFAEKAWRADRWDPETLASQVRRERGALSSHLRQLFAEGGQRLQALAEAVYEAYEDWRENPSRAYHSSGSGSDTTNLRAGLYRVEDPILSDVAYHLYPRTPLRRQAGETTLFQGDTPHLLTLDRPGWYRPLDPVRPDEISNGARFRVEQPSDFQSLILPQRSFWVLVVDPETPESGVFASWGLPALGVPFLLLCRRELLRDLEHLTAEGVFKWDGEPVEVFDGWVELYDCMAVSEAWSGVFIESDELWDALRPTASFTVAASGGLRVPDPTGWVAEYGPRMTVYGFDHDIDVIVTRASDDRVVFESTQRTGVPFDVPWPGPGDYLVEASMSGQRGQRLVKIVSWDQLRLSPAQERETLTIGGVQVCGGAVGSVPRNGGE
jgi:hypothetical protein